MEKEKQAIKFIQKVYELTDKPLYAGNSGGKDSAVLDYLLQKSGIKYTSIYANTTIDPKGTIKHIRENYPHTVIMQPTETFYKLVERKGLPTRLTRYCCEFLKEYVSVGKNIFEGIRSCESKNRQNRDYIQCDNRKWQKGSQHIYPIYDWTDYEIWDFIKQKNIKLAPHYKTGANRLGCVGCPLVSKKGVRKKEFEIYPKYYEAIKKAITKGMAENPQWKITCATDGDGDIAMKWWLSGKTMDEYFNEFCFIKNENKIWEKNKNLYTQCEMDFNKK
jgi:phosphoadenosine phosphosulfate reductase